MMFAFWIVKQWKGCASVSALASDCELTFNQIVPIYVLSPVAPAIKSNFGWPLWLVIANRP